MGTAGGHLETHAPGTRARLRQCLLPKFSRDRGEQYLCQDLPMGGRSYQELIWVWTLLLLWLLSVIHQLPIRVPWACGGG